MQNAKYKNWKLEVGSWKLEADGAARRPQSSALRTPHRRMRGFTLIEILLAVFILGVGLTMVACIFPVGADFTRQNVEETVAGMVAENARAIILAKYTYSDFSAVTTLMPLPHIAAGDKLSLVERAYAYGTSSPYPAAAPATATYFWTALVRQDPETPPLGSRIRYDLYILVFKKGDATQAYTNPASLFGTTGARDLTEAPVTGFASSSYVPVLAQGAVANMPIGAIGIGTSTGTVFHVVPGGLTNPPDANIAYAPSADMTVGTANTSTTGASPLVYVYSTKVSF